MPIGSVSKGTNPTPDIPTIWFTKPAGTYNLVSLDPSGASRCARKIVALAADTWTFEDSNLVSNGPVAVPAGFVHIGHTAGITCGAPIAVYY